MPLRQRLAVLVGARETAEIGALAEAGSGDKECHVRRLRKLLLRPYGRNHQ